jgi:hypothetical protein
MGQSGDPLRTPHPEWRTPQGDAATAMSSERIDRAILCPADANHTDNRRSTRLEMDHYRRNGSRMLRMGQQRLIGRLCGIGQHHGAAAVIAVRGKTRRHMVG